MATPSLFRDGAHAPLTIRPDNSVDNASLWNRSSASFVSINSESRYSVTSLMSMESAQDPFLEPPREDSPALSPLFVISSSGTIRSPSRAASSTRTDTDSLISFGSELSSSGTIRSPSRAASSLTRTDSLISFGSESSSYGTIRSPSRAASSLTRTDSLISFGSESTVHFAPANARDLEEATLQVVTHVRPFGDGVAQAQPATYKLFSENRSELELFSSSTETFENPFEKVENPFE
ncbi:hypothetical protein BDZ89DRAFT_770165 [Hymenopellis radicata]|nr:hypothetical protein BDZ89DRAFT_770165 [Hymenopellis radicata]